MAISKALQKRRIPPAIASAPVVDLESRGRIGAFFTRVMDPRGYVIVSKLATELKTTAADLAITLGLPKEAVSKSARQVSEKTQMRLREMTEILNHAESFAGSMPAALAWYRSQPIPGFGDRTAESMVKAGHAEAVRRYLDHVALGGFA